MILICTTNIVNLRFCNTDLDQSNTEYNSEVEFDDGLNGFYPVCFQICLL